MTSLAPSMLTPIDGKTCVDILRNSLTEVQPGSVYSGRGGHYKIVDQNEVDFLKKVKDAGITPKILKITQCQNQRGQGRYIVKTESFEGTFDDFVNNNQANRVDIQKEVYKIMRLFYKLNNDYKYKQIDAHGYNVVFKNTLYGLKWALIDFENVSPNPTNPYYDLIGFAFQSGYHNVDIQLKNVSQRFVDDFMSNIKNKESFFKEINGLKQGKPIVTIDVNFIK